MPRREALRRVALCGLAGAGVAAGAWWLHGRGVGPQRASAGPLRLDLRNPEALTGAELVWAKGGVSDAAELVRTTVAALGGMGRFVRRGERVLIKPNVGWDRNERQAANTNPTVVATLVRLCAEAGAAEVIVSDVSCNDLRRAFTRSGVGQAARDAGATVLLPGDEDFREVDFGGKVLGGWPVLAPLLTVDRVINVPIVKHHSLTGMTCAMKNLYGIIGGKRNLLHQGIHQSIVDLGLFLRPTLVVVDGLRVLFRNGPQGGSLRDVREEGQIAVTTDPVAADAWAAGLLQLNPRDLETLRMANGLLGSLDLSQARQAG